MDNEINSMFSKIHNNYDFMNHFMSFNFDKGWRNKAASEAMIQKESYHVLDVGSGTGDLAISISEMARKRGKKISILASDFNKDMLSIAEEKIKERRIGNIKVVVEDARRLKHKSNTFDVLTNGFLLRSLVFSDGGVGNLDKFVRESYRVLAKGGKIIMLEMALPESPSQRNFFKVYSHLMRIFGSFIDKETYGWLVDTIRKFDKKRLIRSMESAGFKNIKTRSLRSGIAFIVTGEKT